MRYAIKNKQTDLRLLFTAVSIALVIVTIMDYQYQLPTLSSPRSIIYDESFISVIKDISSSIPKGETIIVSTNPPHFEYFTDHNVKVPYGVGSEAQLYDFMKKGKYSYLVVLENRSAEPALNSLFSTKGLQELEKHFTKLETYDSELIRIQLFQLDMQEQ